VGKDPLDLPAKIRIVAAYLVQVGSSLALGEISHFE
jgi:hypothetical protein